MKLEFDFTQSEYVALTSQNVSDEKKLDIFKRKFYAMSKSTTLKELMNNLHFCCIDFFNYISEQCGDRDVEKLMNAYKKAFISTVDDLKYYLAECIDKGISDFNVLSAEADIFSILNRVRRAYDHAEPFFCRKGLAFVDLNEKRVIIDNCIDKIVETILQCFETDEDTLRENA